jgi:hypothetical protein
LLPKFTEIVRQIATESVNRNIALDKARPKPFPPPPKIPRTSASGIAFGQFQLCDFYRLPGRDAAASDSGSTFGVSQPGSNFQSMLLQVRGHFLGKVRIGG